MIYDFLGTFVTFTVYVEISRACEIEMRSLSVNRFVTLLVISSEKFMKNPRTLRKDFVR